MQCNGLQLDNGPQTHLETTVADAIKTFETETNRCVLGFSLKRRPNGDAFTIEALVLPGLKEEPA